VYVMGGGEAQKRDPIRLAGFLEAHVGNRYRDKHRGSSGAGLADSGAATGQDVA